MLPSSVGKSSMPFLLLAILIWSYSLPGIGQEYFTEPTIMAGDEVPKPVDAVVLTVSGDIGASNTDSGMQFDMQTLEALGVVELEVTDPWAEEERTYSGILLSDLLAVVKLSDNVKYILATAGDGYLAPVPVDQIRAIPIILATRLNGEHFLDSKEGPTRIIFPYDNVEDVKSARQMSVWNVVAIKTQ